jgi:hypothetical protein
MESTLASTTVDGTTILHMTRSFGSHAKSEFDRTLSCGFDVMTRHAVVRQRMLLNSMLPAQALPPRPLPRPSQQQQPPSFPSGPGFPAASSTPLLVRRCVARLSQ